MLQQGPSVSAAILTLILVTTPADVQTGRGASTELP